jgi:hypothetical protein
MVGHVLIIAANSACREDTDKRLKENEKEEM